MSWLNSKVFKCNLCEATFTYERFEAHMRSECELARFKPDCQLCGQIEFGSEEEIIAHWRN